MNDTATELTVGSTDRNAAVIAGFLGWTLDAFDFAIVTMCLPDIAKTYGVSRESITFSVSMTMAMRPVGAFIFGLLADRFGRRRPMMYNLIFYSTLSVLSGFAPTYHTFLLCRALFGVGMGGEWGVGASLAMEKVPAGLRGLLSGVVQEGYALGGLLASAAYFIIVPRYHHWQPLFWLGGLPALLALYIRTQVKESAVWEKNKKENWGSLGAALLSHWKLLFGIFILMFMMNLASHGTQDLFPSLLSERFGLTAKDARGKIAGITAFSQCGMIVGGLVVGFFSDHIGRRWAMIISFILATAVAPLWAYAPSIPLLLTGAFLLQFFVQGAWGVIPAHINELSPDSVRGFLPGFAYQCGAALAGWVVVIEELLKKQIGLTNAMMFSAAIIFPTAALVVYLGKEKAGVEFGQSKP